MYATDFEYDGKRLSDFNCITCCINNSTGVEEVSIGCDITFNTVKNNHSSIQYVTSTTYDNVYTDSFEIMKNTCNENEDKYFSYEEVRSLIRWLSRREYKKFKPIYNNGTDVHYYGSFNVQQIMLGNNVIGLSLTFNANAPYGFGEIISHDFELKENDTFSIYGDSDESNYIIYPNVTITIPSNWDTNSLKLEPGLYDENDVQLASWDELINDYELDLEESYNPVNYQTSKGSPYYILTNYPEFKTATKFIIDNSVESMGIYVFYYCSKLTHITLSDKITELKGSTFSGCSALQTITLPLSINQIQSYVFNLCNSLHTIYFNGTKEDWNSITIDSNSSLKDSVNIVCIENTVSIVNQLSGTNIKIENCKQNETIIIDGENKIITTNSEEHKETICNDFNYEYLDISVTENDVENIYEVNIPCKIKIEYSPIRKVGV